MTKKKLTLDNNTTASNPGEINFKLAVWLRHNLETVVPFSIALILFLILGFLYSYYWLLVVFCILMVSVYCYIRVSEHFSADSNLGVIVSKEPLLLAVYTDLTKGYGSYPVIKVIDYKSLKAVELGMEVGTVSTYSGSLGGEVQYWDNFYPLPVTYATDDHREIEKVLSTYPDGQKEFILSCMEQLPKPYKKGLYRVSLENSDWSN